MAIPMILVQAVLSGVAVAFVWVAFWTVLVPQIASGQAWAGHEGFIVPMFFVGLVGGPLALLFSKR